MRHVYAYTEPHSDYPAYVSLNAPTERGGLHTLTVRSKGDGGRNVATIGMTRDQLLELANSIRAEV